jgi:hypothetical protein
MHMRSWRADDELTLAKVDAAAEIAFSCGDFEEIQPNLTNVYALGSLNRTPEASAHFLDLRN